MYIHVILASSCFLGFFFFWGGGGGFWGGGLNIFVPHYFGNCSDTGWIAMRDVIACINKKKQE